MALGNLVSNAVSTVKKALPPPPSPGYQNALGYYSGQAQTQFGAIDLNQAQTRNQYGANLAAQQLAQSQYGQNVDLANRGTALQYEGLNNDYSALNKNFDYYNAQGDLNLKNLLGGRGYQDQLQGLAERLQTLQDQSVWQTYKTGTRNANSDATARGAIAAPELQSTLKDLLGTKDTGVAADQRGYDATLAGINENRRQLENIFDTKRLDINRNIELTNDQQKALDVRGKEIGLNSDQMLTQLNQGLEKMNLASTISAKDLMAAITSNDFQRQQVAESIIRQATAGASTGYFGPIMPAVPFTGGGGGGFAGKQGSSGGW